MSAWFDEFFEGLYGRVLTAQFKPETSREQARLIRRLLRVRRGQRVLDVPCGQGRLTLPLARTGLVMTGADLTPAFLRKAESLARREGLDCRFLEADMRAIDFDGEFHAAFNWFGSFGYFNDAGNLEFCRRVLRALRPGGRFLLEGINRSWPLRHFRRGDERKIGGVLVAQRSRLDRGKTHLTVDWTLRRGSTIERHTVRMRIYDGASIRALLRSAGFGEVRLYGPGGSRFTRHSRRLIAVARRPG